MSACVQLFYTTPDDYAHRPYQAHYTDITSSAEDCHLTTNGFVLMNPAEYQILIDGESSSSGNLEATLNKLFVFDAQLFAIVEGALIMAFLTSHFGGRIVRWFGKV